MSALIAIVFLAGCQPKKTFNVSAMDAQYVRTFALPACEAIILEYYPQMSNKSDHVAPVKSRTLVEAADMDKILTLVRKLPDEGQIMKKMGNVPLLQVTCVHGEAAEYFEFYDGALKTPATSFYANHPTEEKELFDLVTSLLSE
jgi:hypothetical protein